MGCEQALGFIQQALFDGAIEFGPMDVEQRTLQCIQQHFGHLDAALANAVVGATPDRVPATDGGRGHRC